MHSAGRKATGLTAAALLALTACQGVGDEGPDDGGQEGLDPDGAEDQGDRPDEIADDEDQEDMEDPEDEDVPDLEDIEDTIWESLTAQESVHIRGEISAVLLGLEDPPGSGLDQEEDDENAEGNGEENEEDSLAEDLDTLPVTISGDVEGEQFRYTIGDVWDFVVFEEDVYQSVESIVVEYELEQPPGAEVPEPEEVREAFEEEGSWANWGAEGRQFVQAPPEFLSTVNTSLLDAEDVSSWADAELEGHAETRGEEEVWRYSREDAEGHLELVVLADEDEPLLVELSYLSGDTEAELTFSDWNDVQTPERPDETEVIAPEDVQMLLQDLL